MTPIHEPPVAGYDGMTVMALPRLLKRLDESDLASTLEYEATHADRPIVKRMLTLRMMQLAAETATTRTTRPDTTQPFSPPRRRTRRGSRTC